MIIVCGTDFSEQAQKAGRLAARLAKHFGDKLLLVHAAEPYLAYPAEFHGAAMEVESMQRDLAKRQLEKEAASLHQLCSNIDSALIDGAAEQVLVAAAKEHDARFLVLGSHGRRAPWRWFVGSVAERAVESSNQPVLVIHDEPQGLDDWLSGRRALRLLVGLDESRTSQAAVDWVRSMREHEAVDITFVHYYWPPQEYARFGVGQREDGQADAEVRQVLHRNLRAKVDELPGGGNVEVLVRANWGRRGDVLAYMAEEIDVDMVVVGMHQRHGAERLLHESVSREVLRAARAPVVCVPPALQPPLAAQPIPEIRRVIAATDLSEVGNRTIPYAFGILRASGGIVDIVYVAEHAPSPSHGVAKSSDQISEEERRRLCARLKELIPREAELWGIHTRLHVLDSISAAAAIVQAAERLGADAVCVGSHGHGGVAKALLGSIADEVVQRSPLPVLVVRAGRD